MYNLKHMTVSEKATELINKFHPYCGGTEPMQTENAKKCAALLVEDWISLIRELRKPFVYTESYQQFLEITIHLMEVKEEIINYEP
jgi:hypothetical protein